MEKSLFLLFISIALAHAGLYSEPPQNEVFEENRPHVSEEKKTSPSKSEKAEEKRVETKQEKKDIKRTETHDKKSIDKKNYFDEPFDEYDDERPTGRVKSFFEGME